eukprot:g12052.t2
MGVKAELKAARARMQAGQPSEALAMIQQILDTSSPDLKDDQTMYAALVTAGLAGLASEDLSVAESSFRRASELVPDAPQAWKGLIDCLERAGAERADALPECLLRAAEIAEAKGNFSRARTLRVRLGTVLDRLGKHEEALEAVLHHLDNTKAISAADGSGTSRPAAAVEQLSLLLLAAVLEVDKEEIAVARRVEKRLAKDGVISSSSTGDLTAASRQSRASTLAFEYRAKAIAKDAASTAEDAPSTTIARRLSDALQALLAGSSNGLMTNQQEVGGADGDASSLAQRDAIKTLVARFCRAYLGRVVHTAETGGGRGSRGDPLNNTQTSPTGSSNWQQVLAAGDTLGRAVDRSSGWDDGWIAVTTLLSSAYAIPNDVDNVVGPRDGQEQGAEEDVEVGPASSELTRVAKDGVNDESSGPWLKAEACLHLAGVALWAGDAAEADALLKASSAARATARAQQQHTRSSTNEGVSWVGSLSGPGSDWRELSLRCLVDDRLGNGNAGGSASAIAGDPMASATLALGRVDAATAAFDESFRLRGAPAGGGVYGDVLGHLGLAKGSLLLKLGRLEEARSTVEMVFARALHVHADVDHAGSPHAGEKAGAPTATSEAGLVAVGRPPSLYCRALCVASELDLSEGNTADAKAKLEEVLAVDSRSADALSRLGWLMLGFGSGGSASRPGKRKGARSRREDAEAARPLLEKAVAEQPGSSCHAFRLARCYWEVGGECREDRKYCFNSLLKAAKLDPSNAEAFEWLGYWYERVGADRERARGCFQRAVKLDPSMRGAGEALALLYFQNGQETLAVGLFRQCAAVSVACHWAWAGLGRTKILERKLAEAASHIQQAIRGCPTCWSYWSDLGWCYHTEGKQAAALKAYTRAEELLAAQQCPTMTDEDEDGAVEQGDTDVKLAARVRVRTQVGTIQRQIGQVDEAVSSFEEALSLDPESSLALEGAGEAYLAQAHARTSEGLYTAATKALRNGCEVSRHFLANRSAAASSATSTASGTKAARGGCAWKLLGDLCTYAHKLPPMCFEGEGARKGQQGGERGACELGTKEAGEHQAALAKEGERNRLNFVAQGAHAYGELVKMSTTPERGRAVGEGGESESAALLATKAAAFYDLGLNYLVRARLLRSEAGEGSGLLPQEVYEEIPEVADLARSAETAFKQSIEADPAFSDAWNGLGAVSRDPLVQQHCWVRAVQLDYNPSAWANLGMLYVRWGLDIQAYESFGGLQAVTDHPTMWVGLGLLKEKEACQPGVTAAKRRRLLAQASDAYYSSLETGQHLDGLLGLGTTAGQTHSQPDALVALQQHLDLSPSSAQAWNYLGAASELAGRATQAVTAYRRALGLLEEQGDSLGRGEVWAEVVRMAKVNLGRALVLKGEAEEAVYCLGADDVTEADSMLMPNLHLGRAYALMEDWDKALGALEKDPDGVDTMVSMAVVSYLRGDENGATAAATELVARHPGDRRMLHAVISLAALVGDSGLAQQASRALQALPKRPTASDADGRLSRQNAAEEDLWAIHLAMRATGAPDAACRRALSKAVHLSPSSISSWARLGAATADEAASHSGQGVHPGCSGGGSDGASRGLAVSAKLAEACLASAEKHAMYSLLAKARDAGSNAGGGSAGGASGEVAAKELAASLSGIAKAVMCAGRVGGKSKKSGFGVGANRRSVRASSRAVHLYPGDTLSWRCLTTALVGDALASASVKPEVRDLMLGDARVLSRGLCEHHNRRNGGDKDEDRDCGLGAGVNVSMVHAEADYLQRLLGLEGSDDAECDGSFVSSLRAARAAALLVADASAGGSNGDGGGGCEDAIKRYKLALQVQPRALVAWRELAACYEVEGQHNSSAAALKCGAQALCTAVDEEVDRGSTSSNIAKVAAPLYLQMGASSLSMPGQEDAALASIGEAFRFGKGGVAGHVLRGLVYSRLGKDGPATSALAKAREAGLDPEVALRVEQLFGEFGGAALADD